MYNDQIDHLQDYIGETVTIFTTSGGMSGAGFTGVVLSVNECFVRLITCIGPPPGCALGNACCGWSPNTCNGWNDKCSGNYSKCGGSNYSCGGWNSGLRNIGSVVDIPVSRIVAFVHNAV